ncbi:MAG: TonB-dependent receptor [Chitinophagaceae bacterium]|nr:MAG: TonB-dependent receptor [Chitinophagaceae bacterium]
MKKFFVAFMVAWLCSALTQASAQDLSIGGTILKEGNLPADNATVVLYHQGDSLVLATALSDENGRFLFGSLKPGVYSLLVSITAYKSYQVDSVRLDATSVAVAPIILQQESKTLGDVVISSRKPLVTRKNDRTVVNVDAMISAAGSTALDVLEKSPGVQVDQSGNISLKGKQGVTIFIDDKPTYLSGDQLAAYLRSMPSSSIDVVELMSNPPARYDAAGNGGVINIRTKKIKQGGLNGSINLALTQGQRTRSNNSFNINYRKNRLAVFATLTQSYNNSFTDLDLFRQYKNTDNSPKAFFEQNSYFDREGNTVSWRTGLDFYQDKKSTWGIALNGMGRGSTQQNDNTSNLLGPQRQVDSVIVADNFDRIRFRNLGVNLNFRHEFDNAGQGITADADFITYRNKTKQDYRNFIYNPDGTPKYNDRLDGNLPNNIDIYTFKTDYTKPLGAGKKMEAGLKGSYAETDNIADYLLTTGGVTNPDYDKSNHFIYKETITAGYLNFSWDLKRLSVQAGLRAEHTVSDGSQLGNPAKPDSSFNREYTNLFPTLFLTYKLDSTDTHQFGLRAGRRIDRPYYQDLNPFLYPMDKFTYYSGNPFLQPSFTQVYELSHTWKNRITTGVSYSRTKNGVAETIEISDGIYYSRPGNIGRRTATSLSVDANFDPFKWLNIYVYTELTNMRAKSAFYTGELDTHGTFWYIGPTARITLAKGWTGELSGNYRTGLTTTQFYLRQIWGANMAVQKKISTRITARLSVNDLFYTRINRGVINNLELAEASWINKNDSRAATLNISYSFGKAFSQKKHESSGAESEINRVRN